MKIHGKTILITGAGSGLGAATANDLHNKGAHLILLDINQDSLLSWKDKATCFAVDVCDTERLESIFQTLPKIDVGIFCAGILGANRIVGKTGPYPIEDFQKVIQVNVIGHFNVFRQVAHNMTQHAKPETENGVLIQTASVAAFEGQIGQAAYSASKGAVASMTLPAARELARFGIRVMTIAPGLMDTPMLGQLDEDARRALSAVVPYPKRLAQPKEYAQLVAHIIENEMLNGSTIRLDGALRLP